MTLLLLSIFIASITCTLAGSHFIRAPSVFRSEDAEMHKYAAILAATEPFKASCVRQIMQSVGPLRRIAYLIGGGSVISRAASLRNRIDGVETALSRYEERLSSALRSYNLEYDDFNEISLAAAKDAGLRHKLHEQAYYYKIAADLQSNINNGLATLPTLNRPSILESISSTVLAQLSNARPSSNDVEVQLLTPLQRFARCVAIIEAQRVAMRTQLLEELQVPELPPKMSDPAMQAAFCPKIRRLAAALPRLAESIVQRNGLDVEEFEELQRKLERNPLFRLQVRREIKQLEQQGSLGEV